MGVLSWLGLRNGDSYPNLDALVRELRRALPDDEGVVLRYIAVVVLLLGKVAVADGRFTDKEDQALRGLLSHIDRLAPAGVDAVCSALHGKIPQVTGQELTICYRELRALCDRGERLEVLRLLTQLAAADGVPTAAEHEALETIAAELGVAPGELAIVEEEVATSQLPRGV